MSLLELEGVSTYYGRNPALSGISLRVEQGEGVALIGANGAGKTTTLRTISKLLQPREGRMVFDGHDLMRLRPDQAVQLGIAHCPEERQLFPKMTVQENLEMGGYVHKGGLSDALAFVFSLFPRLKERRHQRAGSLSGGEQQMVAIGRALMSSPRLMMLDEPSLGLAPFVVREVAGVIRNLIDQGIAVLLVEQNVHMAFRVASKGYVLENGRITLDGPISELQDSDHVRRAYLGG